MGYYTSPRLGPSPCIFTSTLPAWNNPNLTRLAQKTASALIFAHVRATTEGNLSESNCHPFCHKSLMFMHNGNIAGWREGVKRRITVDVGEKWFNLVEGSADSPWAFALFLDCLERAGYNPDSDEYALNGFGHTVLRKALLKTIARINGYVADVAPADRRSLLNFAITDGKSVICSRYVSSRTDDAASLYFSSGTHWQRERDVQRQIRDSSPADAATNTDKSSSNTDDNNKEKNETANASPPVTFTSAHAPPQTEYKMLRQDRGSDIVLIASEPLTFEREDWVKLPTNSTITVLDKQQTVLIHPIVDEFWDPSPAHKRSGDLVAQRGLARGTSVNADEEEEEEAADGTSEGDSEA